MPAPPKKVYRDDWDTGSHEAYEEKPLYQPRVKAKSGAVSGLLRSLGGLLIVGGIFWGTYILSSGGDMAALTKAPGPVHVCIAGVVLSVLAKFLE
ncbi:MAG TPA: hypothetical protein VNW97_17055 [Candidatus Saccharimonadales bacterium]|jgi:hypothetical protein|nr:hypothetical protein [Candidatus Saccharimonadales bacterium]